MPYYPILIPLKDKFCLVAGGGVVASRKIITLLNFGAKVRVISPALSTSLKKLIKENKIQWKKGKFSPSDLVGAALVFGTTNDRKTNELISKEAKKRKIPANIVDNEPLCTFICPSIVKRGPLTIAISTDGKLPALSKKIRIELEKKYGKEYEDISASLTSLREKLKKQFKSSKKRKKIWDKIMQLDISKPDILKKFL